MNARSASKNRRVALMASSGAALMLGLAYASVPLYSLFCQVTGWAGTTQRADKAPATQSELTIVVRFDANTDARLGWDFHPVQGTVKARFGEQVLAHYEAVNRSDRTMTGTAVFNVTPPEAGSFFNKIDCFCFSEQTLKPGERADFPVVFFVDPEILKDPDTKSIREITLSYTFYPVDKSGAQTAAVKTN
jgi:cytochrome c oxidase assembly protein subunit 11